MLVQAWQLELLQVWLLVFERAWLLVSVQAWLLGLQPGSALLALGSAAVEPGSLQE